MKARFVGNGVKTRVLHEGTGAALIMLHPIGHSADLFVRNIDALARDAFVAAVDLPGHGFSDRIAFGAPPQLATARHVLAVADALGLQQFSVLGSSYGALVAALMWFAAPERIDRVILVGSGSVFHPPAEQAGVLRQVQANGTSAMADPSLNSCRQRLANICYRPESVPEEILPVQLTSYALADRLAAYEETLAGVIASAAAPEAWVYERLEALSAPALVITGREDIRARWKMHEEGCRRLPRAELEIFEQCGHVPFLEHPERFNTRVRTFLGL
jgi:pimeloyl-ACP methyl ester carboxylesterase